MIALTQGQYGSPEILKFDAIEAPQPTQNELLIKVHATTVNRTDCAYIRAHPPITRIFTGLRKPKKKIPGTEFAGEVLAVGKKVNKFKTGNRVFGFNDMGIQSHAEYLVVSQNAVVDLIPENISYDKATASVEGFHYAYNFITKILLVPGQKVLVNGADGGIGSAAVQLLKYYQADVTAVCHPKNKERIKALGANFVLDYLNDDFTQLNHSFDYVFDTVGKSSFNACKPILKPQGIYISSELGHRSENLFYALRTSLHNGKKVKFPFPANPKKSLSLVKKMLEKGTYDPLIDKEYPFDEIIEAYRYVEKGLKTGNVVIRVS